MNREKSMIRREDGGVLKRKGVYGKKIQSRHSPKQKRGTAQKEGRAAERQDSRVVIQLGRAHRNVQRGPPGKSNDPRPLGGLIEQK